MQRVEGDDNWARLLNRIPSAHLLQTSTWGEFKSHFGWEPERWSWSDAGGNPLAAAQLLRRDWPGPPRRTVASLLYCPRGPAMDWTDAQLAGRVLRDLSRLAAGPTQ